MFQVLNILVINHNILVFFAIVISNKLITTITIIRTDPEAREHRQLNSYITRMEKEGVERVKMFVVVIVAYIVFWGPLFLLTLMTPAVDKPGIGHDVSTK